MEDDPTANVGIPASPTSAFTAKRLKALVLVNYEEWKTLTLRSFSQVNRSVDCSFLQSPEAQYQSQSFWRMF